MFVHLKQKLLSAKAKGGSRITMLLFLDPLSDGLCARTRAHANTDTQLSSEPSVAGKGHGQQP